MEKIKPYLVEKPWGGNFLSKFYQTEKQNIGEAWLLSTLPDGESKVGDQRLSEYLGRDLSFLIKIIDAKDPLSIQVHPNDDWAKKLENSRGKTECWLILGSTPGAGLYLGLKPGVTEDEFRSAILKNESVESLMEFFPATVGDFISVPAGTIHAIGGGVTLMEVQQSSGITYRLWDWGRPGRELHIDKGLKVSDYVNKFEVKKNIFENFKKGLLLKHADFETYLNESRGSGWFVDLKTYEVYAGEKSHSESYLFVR
jgi:mannose-6-phosphate isomerase